MSKIDTSMFKIPEFIYGNENVCDHYIGRVVEVDENAKNYWGWYCKIKRLDQGRVEHLRRETFCVTEWDDFGCEKMTMLVVPSIGQLIQCVVVQQGYGAYNLIKFLDKIEDASPIPGPLHIPNWCI